MGVAWEEELAPKLHGRVVLAAIGDRGAGDDAAAPFLVDLLAGATDLTLLDCGSYPQNFLSVIARDSPDVVMLVDAAELGLLPGQMRVLELDSVADWGGGSHGFPMELLMQQIHAMTNAAVFLCGIQVGQLVRGAPLSPLVEAAVRDLGAFLTDRHPRSHSG